MPHENRGTLFNQVVRDGRIIDLRKDWQYHGCKLCPIPIIPQESYYSISWTHSGLGRVNEPDRVHEKCLEKYLKGDKWR